MAKARHKVRQMKESQENTSDYGGSLMKSRDGRMGPRPLATKQSMHLMLKSSLARGKWSFAHHEEAIYEVTQRFCERYDVDLISLASAGNYLHFHIRLSSKRNFAPFIRGLTAALMMAVTGTSRWHKPKVLVNKSFWDRRPFTRIIPNSKAQLTSKDYAEINDLDSTDSASAASRLHWRRRSK